MEGGEGGGAREILCSKGAVPEGAVPCHLKEGISLVCLKEEGCEGNPVNYGKELLHKYRRRFE